MRDGFAAKGDAGGAVVPGAAHVELDVFAVGFVFEGDGRFVGEECKLLGNHKQLVALWVLRTERLVDCEMLVLQGEELIVMHVRECLLIAQGQQLPFAFANLDAVDGLDREIVAGEGEGFFLHVQGDWLRVAL